ncbi:MAG TPA: class I SAM-dependent methyltransferase [Cytophagaceae bacterium]|nr:class I SAM-dependent methyltransferase [Cytophagaceae bacterium]
MAIDFFSVNKAFSKQSFRYDEEDRENVILQWMRGEVRTHVERYLKKTDRMLELNAGTGLDAFYFIHQGAHVHATDLSDGMVEQIGHKIKKYDLQTLMSCQQCSYTSLDQVQAGPFQYVFSNFGGLNCIPDLKEVIKHLPSLLTPGAYITWVIMPPVCPWEFNFILKGNFKRAFRRFNKEGVMAHLEGQYFKTYYFTPSQVVQAFGKDFKKISLQGLASISPPPHNFRFQKNFPGLYKMLTKTDEKLSNYFPFNCWADHFILTMQYHPQD